MKRKNYFFLVLFLLASNAFCLNASHFIISKVNPYYIMEANVNLREGPNLNAKVIKKLQKHEVIYILETAHFQTIDTMGFNWFKVKTDNDVGFVYGAYIADQRFISIINNNEIIVYIRRSYYDKYNHFYADVDKDISVYINGKKIDIRFPHGEWNLFFYKTTNSGMSLLFSYPQYTAPGEDPRPMNFYEFIINTSGQIEFAEFKEILWDDLASLGYMP